MLKHTDQGLMSLLLQQIQFDENFSMLNIQGKPTAGTLPGNQTPLMASPTWCLIHLLTLGTNSTLCFAQNLWTLMDVALLNLSVESGLCSYSYWL
jgi:hypothetical protein